MSFFFFLWCFFPIETSDTVLRGLPHKFLNFKTYFSIDLGIRPYACYLCRDTFSRSDILKRHFQKCSQRRGNPGGQDHLAEKRRKNRSYSTVNESWRSASRSASRSGELPHRGSAGLTGSLSSAINATSTLTPKTSLRSLSASSSRSSSLARTSNSLETGRRMSSAEFLSQQSQNQEQQGRLARERLGYRSVSATEDLSFNLNPATSSKTTLAESLAAYSLPQASFGHGKSNSYEYLKGSGFAHKQANGLQSIDEAVSWDGSGINYHDASTANDDGYQRSESFMNDASGNAQQEQARQQFQQKGLLYGTSISATNNESVVNTPRIGSTYRANSATHATLAPLNAIAPNALANNAERRPLWSSISSQRYGNNMEDSLATRRHTLQTHHHFDYYGQYHQHHQEKSQQEQQQQQQQQQQLKAEQHQLYQHRAYPYGLDANSQPGLLAIDQKQRF